MQRASTTQQRNRTPGAIAALTPVLGTKPAQQPDPLPDSPEALPVTARTPGSSTPATQPANTSAAEARSPEAPATQSGAEEEPMMAAERPQRLLLVFDGRPYVLHAKDVIGLAVPDTLAGDHKPILSCPMRGASSVPEDVPLMTPSVVLQSSFFRPAQRWDSASPRQSQAQPQRGRRSQSSPHTSAWPCGPPATPPPSLTWRAASISRRCQGGQEHLSSSLTLVGGAGLRHHPV